ncbi:uncharacterized protein K460DRAFT_369739 [Cucurbitaria berberidis CBS 394.84]|uniref:Uncharacterized protein n=1 Tax=Cucurbitaria berberidis CBS 394.84 TaxID=1168544 RepID=A0A9P4GAL7_9PLEO|nr:uncharacterized protein K460DRAFT_369739 [Cucurbitaria berberidis CBS 394.84]KAF1841735.1 hypothetical protein K460DRAFT_369739 [Cucurbitaria berberidis CBS 394.84]
MYLEDARRRLWAADRTQTLPKSVNPPSSCLCHLRVFQACAKQCHDEACDVCRWWVG